MRKRMPRISRISVFFCHELNEFHEFSLFFVRFLILFALVLDGESGALRGHKNAKLLLNKYFGNSRSSSAARR